MAPDGSEYVDEIKALVCKTFDVDPDTIDENTPFAEMGVDSRRRVRLLATVEVEFGIDIDLDELDRLVDIRGAATVLAEAVETGAKPRKRGLPGLLRRNRLS
ncbi:acyl carrier protein [Amycolatopsis sp. cmx-11-12]|uniref:acyl carrier protein n=1 Tax=Amycolatopsis sp. cmx-11-12 TaxID=2785795 RepID=UPI00391735E9